MKRLLIPLWLLCATVACGSTAIDREKFSLVLPVGWAEANEANPIVIVGEEGQEDVEQKYPRFIASTKDCSCIFSFAPRSPQITAESQSVLQAKGFRTTSTISTESRIHSIGGREGFGYEMVCRHPYPVISVVRVFSFESNGYVCTLLVTTSDEKKEQAADRMARHTPAIEEIVRSIKIKNPGESGSRG